MDDRWFLDSLPSERYPNYTRANAGEVMPDPMSPLSASLGMMAAGEPGWRDALVRTGCFRREEFDLDRHNPCACFGSYFYLSLSCVRIYGARFPGLSPETVDVQYFGTTPGVPPYSEEARPTDEDPVALANMGRWLQEIFATEDLPDLRADAAQVDKIVARRPNPNPAETTDQELIDHARTLVPLYRRMFCRHIMVSAAVGVGIGTVTAVCTAIGEPELAMVLNASVGDVDSAAPSYALWDLSRLVAGSPALTKEFEAGVEGLLGRLRSSGDPDGARFVERFGEFLARFGARGTNEWELRSAVWAIRPELALSAVERLRLAPEHESPHARAELRATEREAATEKVRAMLAGDAEAAAQFEGGLRCSHVFAAGRERCKTNIIRLVHEQRLAARELGRRMVERGHLDHVEQIFMLADDEVDAFLADPGSYRERIVQRERDYLALFDVEPPFFISHTVPPLPSWSRRGGGPAVAQAVSGTVLSGIPGSPGKARGRARIVLDPGDPAGLEPGDVLVAPQTDPSWTPLFLPASAVVVDVGAQITHAVIVSRELGLPCVVSVTGATRTIPDGAMVEVDGAAGTVTVL